MNPNNEQFQVDKAIGGWVETGLKTDDLNEDPKIKQFNIDISKLTIKINQTTDPSERSKLIKEKESLEYDKTIYLLKVYFKKFLFYFFVFSLMTFNLIVVAVSLSCSLGESFVYRIMSALFAFFFGIFYLIVNYKYYRLNSNISCVIQSNNPFAI